MKQKIKHAMQTNAFAGPTKKAFTEIRQDILDIQKCLDTDTAVIRNLSKHEKQSEAERAEKRKPDTAKETPSELLSELGHWNKLKKFQSQTPELMQNNVLDMIKGTKEHLNRFTKFTMQKSSGIMCMVKDTVEVNTPKVGNSVRKSLKRMFGGEKSLDQKDLDLLKRLAELKEEGILSPTEFALKKKQILKKP